LSDTGGWTLNWSRGAQDQGAIPLTAAAGLGFDINDPRGGWAPVGNPGRAGPGLSLRYVQRSVAALAGRDLHAVVNRAFAEGAAATVGDSVLVLLPGGRRTIVIQGVVDAIPTTDPARAAVIVDLASYSLSRFAAEGGVQPLTEWWLGDGNVDAGIQAARIGGPLEGTTVATRTGTWQRLATDPLALATIGALSLGFVVAGLFAVIGLAVSASVSARQRRTEFALLRALGLSPDQLSGWLWLENASLVAVSLVAGTILGLVIGWVVLPFITVTSSGGVPFPPVIVEVPWPSIAVLEAISVVALAVTLVVLARSMRRAGVGSVLRMGED